MKTEAELADELAAYRAKHPELTTEAAKMVQDVSLAIVDDTALRPIDAAELMERYYALSEAKYITADGDVLTAKDYERERDYLKAQLKDYIAEHDGHPLTREGLPDLALKPRSTTWYNLELMAQLEPAMLDFLMRQGYLDVKASAREAARAGSPELMGLSKYEQKGDGTPALTWDRRR